MRSKGLFVGYFLAVLFCATHYRSEAISSYVIHFGVFFLVFGSSAAEVVATVVGIIECDPFQSLEDVLSGIEMLKTDPEKY